MQVETLAPLSVHMPVDDFYVTEIRGNRVLDQPLDSRRDRSMLGNVLWQFQMFSRLVQSPGLKLGHDSWFMPRRERYRTWSNRREAVSPERIEGLARVE